MQRDARLRGLSSEHHQALVLARRLSRAEIGVTPSDAETVQARFASELEPHFRVEEEVLLPALGAAGAHALVERTLADHGAIREAVAALGDDDRERARALGERIADHVRFEERELFPACERLLSAASLDEALRRSPAPRG